MSILSCGFIFLKGWCCIYYTKIYHRKGNQIFGLFSCINIKKFICYHIYIYPYTRVDLSYRGVVETKHQHTHIKPQAFPHIFASSPLWEVESIHKAISRTLSRTFWYFHTIPKDATSIGGQFSYKQLRTINLTSIAMTLTLTISC